MTVVEVVFDISAQVVGCRVIGVDFDRFVYVEQGFHELVLLIQFPSLLCIVFGILCKCHTRNKYQARK